MCQIIAYIPYLRDAREFQEKFSKIYKNIFSFASDHTLISQWLFHF